MSNVHSLYEANEQKAPPEGEHKNRARYDEAPSNAHQPLDSNDQRTIANRLDNEARRQGDKDIDEEAKLAKKDPTLPALVKGNEPSKGAKIDKQIQEEEEEELRRKGKK